MNKWMKNIISVSLMSLTLIFTTEALAVQPINFEGPKITYDRKLMGLGDFAVFNFMGQNKVDAAVPSNIHSTVVGMDNLNQWPQLGPNVFYNLNSFYEPDRIMKPIQVMEGNFNGSGSSDLVVLNPGTITICKDYTGATCGAGFSNLQIFTDGTHWHGAVGKLKDNKDTVAVITQSGAVNAGRLLVYSTDAAGEVQVPYYNQPVPEGTPYSLAIGDYDNDGKPDIAVASQKYNPSTSEVIIYFYKNTGAGFAAPVQQFAMKDHECYTPTGLLSYDPDGDSKSDLVLTCFDRLVHPDCEGRILTLACPVSRETGYVYLLKNTGGFFNLEHTIKNGIKYPYSSAVGKFNEDTLFDVAVANYGARSVSVYAGDATFKTEDVGKHYVTRFTPKYIQVADKNGDTLQDIIAVASSRSFARFFPLSTAAAQGGVPFVTEAFAAEGMPEKAYIFADDNGMTDSIYKSSPEEIMAKYSNEIEPYAILEEPNKTTYKLVDLSKYMNISYEPVLYTPVTEADSMAKTLSSGSKIRTPDAVIVLINYRPQVSFDPVNCASTKVVAHCIPAAGHTISPANCVFNSADIPAAVANVQKTVNGNGVDLTFNLPQEERDYTATVTGTDESANSVTETIVVKRQGCTPPQTSVTCPSQKARFEVWVDDPFQMCVPIPGVGEGGVASASASSAYSVDFTQNAGPNMFAVAGTGSHLAAQTVTNGNCLSGRFAFPDNDIDVRGTYKIKNNMTGADVAECPWEGKIRAALIEGSGQGGKCSLDKSESVKFTWSALLLLFLAPIVVIAGRKSFFPHA